MRIRLDSPTLVDDLMRALEERLGAVVERVGDTELEAVLVGSFHDGGEAELERAVSQWLEERGAARRRFRIVR
jgi:hypothetical protein